MSSQNAPFAFTFAAKQFPHSNALNCFICRVTSSEKVDKENRYSEFTIISLPYPGCEFFREFRDNNYSHESLVFDWSQTHVNADIGIPMDSITSQLLHINWDQYKVWDLVTITQNYLKLCLKYLQDNSSGLLIHCIRYET